MGDNVMGSFRTNRPPRGRRLGRGRGFRTFRLVRRWFRHESGGIERIAWPLTGSVCSFIVRSIPEGLMFREFSSIWEIQGKSSQNSFLELAQKHWLSPIHRMTARSRFRRRCPGIRKRAAVGRNGDAPFYRCIHLLPPIRPSALATVSGPFSTCFLACGAAHPVFNALRCPGRPPPGPHCRHYGTWLPPLSFPPSLRRPRENGRPPGG